MKLYAAYINFTNSQSIWTSVFAEWLLQKLHNHVFFRSQGYFEIEY